MGVRIKLALVFFLNLPALGYAQLFDDTSEWVFRDLTEHQSLEAVTAHPDQFNALKAAHLPLANTINAITSGLGDSSSIVSIERAKQLEQANSKETKIFYSGIGSRTGAHAGKTIYYPFGGVDVHSPYWINPNAVDVVSVGAEAFGAPGDFAKWGNASPAEQAGLFFGFDSIRDLRMMQHDLDMKGVGPIGVSRLLSLADARIESVSYFNINEAGNLEFLPVSALGPESLQKNAVVFFRTPDGRLRRYWYIKHHTGTPEQGTMSFLQKLRFKTMLIKGAPSRLFTKSDKSAAFEISTDLAKRNGAVTIADQRISDNGTNTHKGPQPIFQKTTGVKEVKLPKAVQYGYGHGELGQAIYIGDSESLITSRPIETGTDILKPAGSPEGRRGFSALVREIVNRLCHRPPSKN